MPTAIAAANFSYPKVSKALGRRGQFETLEPHPSHRKLIALLIAAAVLGGGFLYFWQTVLQFSFLPQEFNEEFCVRLLGRYQPDLQTGDFVEASAPGEEVQRLDASFFGEESKIFSIEKVGSRVRSCGVVLTTDRELGGYGDPYPCGIGTVRYRSEETSGYLLVAGQTELPQELAQTGFPRFSYDIKYYNPDARSSYDAALSQFRQHFCAEAIGE